ncbi:xanthine dehydrogenase accessory factor [Plasticicumulans lactativorans]|uniref:Xanthine dehydrogenase accessory factor n=1 Tax=Plasticicumulans lactativorans TaxID=1133106 RepID=A0A4R2LQQ1_9GAMM|nr:xanthine dehydrogenase accessory protein XdhC [Plasticicumulans lactativorans]TCO81911.1 xanthine dehydrogenase accessory factor [Plasticicumulans lactativorans]
MSTWLDTLAALRVPAVLVTLVGARGSVPREPGTRMLVTADALYDSIGGGGLEHHAIAHARALLADGDAGRRLQRFPLGLAFGQCCGGVAFVSFEYVALPRPAWVAALAARAGHPCVRVARVDAGDACALVVDTHAHAGSLGSAGLDAHAIARARECLVAGMGAPLIEPLAGGSDAGVGREPALIYEPVGGAGLQLALFGAGHVGRALVHVLAPYAARIDWIDPRADVFPEALPAGVRAIGGDAVAAVAGLGAGSLCVVMTHDHALDLELCVALLARPDLPFVGLIGSRSKRSNFERRLRQRGVDAGAIARLVSPIGVDGIHDKHPAAIAIAVAAQLLHVHTATRAAPPRPAATHRRLPTRHLEIP